MRKIYRSQKSKSKTNTNVLAYNHKEKTSEKFVF